jgi:DNA-binding response OmpR family regulator
MRWGTAVDANAKNSAPIRVLFVEDEFLIAEWIAQSLTERGFAVKIVSNAGDALRHMGRSAVDILVTDINLPGLMSGTALARRARELQPDLPVIYASARAALLEQEVLVPGSVLLPKPYEPGAVARLLAVAIHSAALAVPA